MCRLSAAIMIIYHMLLEVEALGTDDLAYYGVVCSTNWRKTSPADHLSFSTARIWSEDSDQMFVPSQMVFRMAMAAL